MEHKVTKSNTNEDVLNDKTVLITGGTGSFGKNFADYLLKNHPIKKVIIFSRDELKQFELQKHFTDDRVRFFIGDIRDLSRLERAFKGVDIVVHAAALKHVPAMEYNPSEAVKTNIEGTQNVIDAAINQGVERLLLVSTDKAAEPVNLYGATKLCAEKLCISGNAYSDKTKISAVRYGNVIGSRGSIIETLLKNKDAQEVHITDPNMTRFWITLPQTFKLVHFALCNMVGGELFIPKVPSAKITDIFDVITPHAKKNVIGIRPGEKLHEILLTSQEARRAYDIGDYYVALPELQFLVNDYSWYQNSGKKLDDFYSYTSDTNDVWFTKKDLQEIVEAFYTL